jgi:hypothetical protein
MSEIATHTYMQILEKRHDFGVVFICVDIQVVGIDPALSTLLLVSFCVSTLLLTYLLTYLPID